MSGLRHVYMNRACGFNPENRSHSYLTLMIPVTVHDIDRAGDVVNFLHALVRHFLTRRKSGRPKTNIQRQTAMTGQEAKQLSLFTWLLTETLGETEPGWQCKQQTSQRSDTRVRKNPVGL
ncbi:hypothetical protein ElyMa_004341700 [Elysia marginata]|uniref:Uncharacterized protein n=1 Tax=Elysia marginata TaxID=1093978 RepID=A0AAV4H3E7_9GAST|nr:hypothetical protein ElyMa_004341700 [Elysia marginata]